MSQYSIRSIDDFKLKDKRVFVRADFNVPIEGGEVKDHIRLESALSTIKYALENQAKVIVAGHKGRPAGSYQKTLSLEPFGYYLGKRLNCEVVFIEEIDQAIPSVLLSSKKILLLENLRFHPGEEKGDEVQAERMASYVDLYINEAFSVSHRKHTSVYLLPQKVKMRGQGFSVQKERETLDHLRSHPSSPFVLLVGGVKVADKIKVLTRLLDRVDVFLIGGGMAYTFLKAAGVSVGEALVHEESVKTAKEFMDRLRMRDKKFFLPVDHLVASTGSVGSAGKKQITSGANVPKGFCPLDVGPKTIQLFSEVLVGAKTIFWNGPLGKFEDSECREGTLSVCSAVVENRSAFKVMGGGDSISAILQGNLKGFDYMSTGGGATLKYLETGTLPGLESLKMLVDK